MWQFNILISDVGHSWRHLSLINDETRSMVKNIWIITGLLLILTIKNIKKAKNPPKTKQVCQNEYWGTLWGNQLCLQISYILGPCRNTSQEVGNLYNRLNIQKYKFSLKVWYQVCLAHTISTLSEHTLSHFILLKQPFFQTGDWWNQTFCCFSSKCTNLYNTCLVYSIWLKDMDL